MSKNRYKNQPRSNKKPDSDQQNPNSFTQKEIKGVIQKTNYSMPQLQKLDSRTFSKEAHKALIEMTENEENKFYLKEEYRKKASALVQGLTAYISTWGLHRLSGDAKKFLQKESEDTKYKGKVYLKFLETLKTFSGIDFDVNNEGSLIHLPLREYTALNRFAIQFAKEWAFWTPSVLGQPEDE